MKEDHCEPEQTNKGTITTIIWLESTLVQVAATAAAIPDKNKTHNNAVYVAATTEERASARNSRERKRKRQHPSKPSQRNGTP